MTERGREGERKREKDRVSEELGMGRWKGGVDLASAICETM